MQQNTLLPSKQLSAGDMSLASVAVTLTIPYLNGVAIQVNYSGSPVGTLTMEGSVDGTNFVPMTFQSGGASVASLAIPTATSPVLIDVGLTSVPYLRVHYVRTSGSGSMDVWLSAKQI